jgi:hypothetical protein
VFIKKHFYFLHQCFFWSLSSMSMIGSATFQFWHCVRLNNSVFFKWFKHCRISYSIYDTLHCPGTAAYGIIFLVINKPMCKSGIWKQCYNATMWLSKDITFKNVNKVIINREKTKWEHSNKKANLVFRLYQAKNLIKLVPQLPQCL